MTQRSPKSNVIETAGILATFVVGAVFFFTIIGVFGLRPAIVGLALGILIAVVITRRAPRGNDVL
jgi:dolichol kinase